MADSGFGKVAQVGDLSPGEMIAVEVGGDRILLANVGGNIHAIDDICSHAYATLSDGELEGQEVECPLHGGKFNLTTGEAIGPPADEAVQVYKVQIEGDDILVGPANG